MKPSFNRRSVFDLRIRWRSHIGSKTVHDGMRFIFRESDPNCTSNRRKQCEEHKICPKSAVPTILKEDQLLVQKINEMGTNSAVIAPSFAGRSENAVKDGGFQFETVDDGKKAVPSIPLEEWDSESLFMDSMRESMRNLWDQMMTEDESER
jgi:hypothetical protein